MLKMNKVILFLLALLVAFSLVGCGTTSTETQNDTKQKTETTEKQQTEKKKSEEDKDKDVEKETAATIEPDPNKQDSSVNSTTPSTQTTQEPVVNQTQATPQAPAKPAASTVGSSTAVTPPAPAPAPVPEKKATISIVGPKDNRSILGATKIEIKDGYTVLDVLKATGITVDISGSGATAYVEGIDNVYEFDYGPQSGWTYKLNGVQVQQSAGTVKVKDGDQIVWEYVGG